MKKNIDKYIYRYKIKDEKDNTTYKIRLNVEVYMEEEQLFLECTRNDILVKAIDIKSGKEEFNEIVYSKIKDAINKGYLKELVEAWNIE